MARVLTNVTMCVDCAFIIANDDSSSLNCTCEARLGGGDHTSLCSVGAHLREMALNMARTPGTWVVGTTGDAISAEPCDACGDTKHGERMHGHVLVDTPAPAEGVTYDHHGRVDPFAHDPNRTTRREAWL